VDDTGSFVAIRPRRHSLRHGALHARRCRRASTRMRLAAIVTAAAAVLAGCTTTGSGVQTQDLSTAPSMSSVTQTNTTEPATSSATMPSATASSSPVTSAASPSTATSDPWPANLTPAQQDQARAALAVLGGYIQVTNAASADPGAKDWTADIRKYTADPAATQILDALASYVSAGVHQVGPPIYEQPVVTEVVGNKVSIQACLDQSGLSLVDSNGASALQPIENPRVLWEATVFEYEEKDGGWLLSETATAKPVTPC